MHTFRQSDKFIFENLFALERFLEMVAIPYLAECTKYKWLVCFLQSAHLFSIRRNNCIRPEECIFLMLLLVPF